MSSLESPSAKLICKKGTKRRDTPLQDPPTGLDLHIPRPHTGFQNGLLEVDHIQANGDTRKRLWPRTSQSSRSISG